MSTLTHFDETTRKSNPKAALARVEFRDAQGYGNQRKHDLRIGAQPGYVNGDLTELNRMLVDPLPTAWIKTLARERRSQRGTQRAMKKNAGVAITGLIGFGIEAQSMFDALAPKVQDEALRTLVNKIAEAWNTSVTGLVLHRDETALHAHFSLCGYDKDGEPLSNRIKRGQLHDLQTMTHTVLQQYMADLERGQTRIARLKAGAPQHEVINRSVAQLHADLPHEIAEKEQELVALEEASEAAQLKLEKNTRLAEKAALKADEENERAEKAAKNLARYEARAAAAQAEIETLESRRADLLRDIEEKQARINTDLAAAAQDRAVVEKERQDSAALHRQLEEDRRALEERETAVRHAEDQARATQVEAERIKGEAETVAAEAAQTAVEAVAGVIEGSITYDMTTRKWQVRDAGLRERLRPVLRAVRPALTRVNTWWEDVRARMDKASPLMRALFKKQVTDTLEALKPPEGDEAPKPAPPEDETDQDPDEPGPEGPGM